MDGKIAHSVLGHIKTTAINMSSTKSKRIILKSKIRNQTCDTCGKARIVGLEKETGEYGYSCVQFLGEAVGLQLMPVPIERTCEDWEAK